MQNIIIREATAPRAGGRRGRPRQTGLPGVAAPEAVGLVGLVVEVLALVVPMMYADPHSVLYVAVRGDEIVGTVSLNGLPRRMSHRAELGITVLMSEWGKGLGSRLMETVIDFAEKSGIEIIELAVRSDNERAIRLYKKHGFESVGVYKSYFKIDEKYADFKLMNLYLI